MTILVTGGAGFIGCNFIRGWLASHEEPVVNLDALTYAGNPSSLADFAGSDRYEFVCGSINDGELLDRLMARHLPRAVINFAAESHVDRSISGPEGFLETNVMGLLKLLSAATAHFQKLDEAGRAAFRFVQISTDEVYGSLAADEAAFHESRKFEPNSPYSASKAAGDHLVRAWHHTYGLPVLTTNCSNNYGPYQFPEKLIPLVILNALAGKPLPIYGDGMQIRDWLYVSDHCRGISCVLADGRVGETYNIGGNCERPNIEVVKQICAILDRKIPRDDGRSYAEQITFVKDRPGHDRRYAVDTSKITNELGWEPDETFESGLEKTVDWYLANSEWTDDVSSGAYREWVAQQYGSAS